MGIISVKLCSAISVRRPYHYLYKSVLDWSEPKGRQYWEANCLDEAGEKVTFPDREVGEGDQIKAFVILGNVCFSF